MRVSAFVRGCVLYPEVAVQYAWAYFSCWLAERRVRRIWKRLPAEDRVLIRELLRKREKGV